MIPMIHLQRELSDIGAEIRSAIDESLKRASFVNGPAVKELEKNVATTLGVKHAIAVANGTDALHLALRGMGIKAGDEVITTPFTFFATAEVLAYIGAVPVFADVDYDTMNIDPSEIRSKITRKTKAIIPVHLFGNPANMDAVMEIAEKNRLLVLEDCAQSFGATYKGRHTGSIGHAGAFSFYPTKNLGAYGDAGMVTTNDDHVAEKVRSLKEHGSTVRYYHDEIGYNSRLDDIQAAILNVKLKHIERFTEERQRIASLYRSTLNSSFGFQKENRDGVHVYHQFTLCSKNRDGIIDILKKNEIASSIFYPIPLHLQNAFLHLGGKQGDHPMTESLAKQVVSLPMNPYLEDEEVQVICDLVNTIKG